MYRLGKIDQARYLAAIEEPIAANYHVPKPELSAPYIAEMARAGMVGRYGSEAYTEGFRVYVTVPSNLQESANRALHEGLRSYDQRHGYRGPEARLAELPREQWPARLAQQRSLGGLEPALVTQVEQSGILVMLRNGEEQAVAWTSMQWARPFLNSNSMGPVHANRPISSRPAILSESSVWMTTDSFRPTACCISALVTLDPANGAIRAW